MGVLLQIPGAQRGFENTRGHAVGLEARNERRSVERSVERRPERRPEGPVACLRGLSNPRWARGSGENSTKQIRILYFFFNITLYQSRARFQNINKNRDKSPACKKKQIFKLSVIFNNSEIHAIGFYHPLQGISEILRITENFDFFFFTGGTFVPKLKSYEKTRQIEIYRTHFWRVWESLRGFLFPNPLHRGFINTNPPDIAIFGLNKNIVKNSRKTSLETQNWAQSCELTL